MKKITERFFKRNTDSHYIPGQGAEVKVLFSSENPALLGQTVNTKAIELSPKSIRLEIEHSIEIDSVLDISVKLDGSDRTYNLTGNIRWKLPSPNGKYHVVLVLRERNDVRSDLKAWKSNFIQNFEYSKAS